MIELTLRPHIERSGYHTDRFGAYLNGELVCVSRSGWYEPARKLVALGYPPETLLRVRHESKPMDTTVVPQTLGELARWTIEESDRRGLLRRKWRPFDGSRFEGVGGENGDSPVPEGDHAPESFLPAYATG